jgi:hypothetical protein
MKLSINDPMALSPWGKMRHTETRNDFLSIAPTDFRLLPGQAPKQRAASWIEFFEATLDVINATLWPRFDYSSQEWVGDSASRMRLLTKKDHEVLARIQSHPQGLELYRPVRSPIRAANCPIQEELFTLEDTEKLATAYRYYDRELAKLYSGEAIETLRVQAMYAKVANVSTQFKYHLQRPRPYQTAVLFAGNEFRYHAALTSHTPSMCSGHAVQSALAAGGMLERFWAEKVPGFLTPNSPSVLALTQWAVDAGDRRVLAGVHYPSDNLCSWLIFLHLANRVYTDQRVKTALWSAITKQSYVYQEIRAAAQGDPAHPYHPGLAALDQAAQSRP